MTKFGSQRILAVLLAMAGTATSQTKVNLQRQTNASIHQDTATGQVSVMKGFNTPITALSFSATPAFDAGSANGFTMVLTGNVTSSTLTNAKAGQLLAFRLCQDSTGA